jgi:Mn2+/Fe2+ NRAMP family transporter
MTTRVTDRPESEQVTGTSPPCTRAGPVGGATPRPSRHVLGAVGPGVVSGAADVDPTTVATLAVIGAGTVYHLAWLTLLLFPMIAVVQVIGTHVGVVGRKDLQTAVAQNYGSLPRWLLLISIVAVSIVTIGADLEGGAAAIGLLTGLNWRWFVLPLSLGLLAVMMVGGFDHVQRALKYFLVCLLAYAGAAVLAHPDWGAVARGSLIPQFRRTGGYTADALSLVGTTLTSYVYVWQTIAHAERRHSRARLRAGKIDAIVGSFFAVAVCWFVLIAVGATLGVHHLQANTPAEIAQSLRPVAGPLAGALFAVGLFASAVVALPVLIATTAYVTGAQLHWERGLSVRVREAPLFYGVLATSTLLGAGIALSGVSPVRLLFIAGIIAGIATPIGLILLLAVAGDHKLMHDRPVSGSLLVAGWIVTAVIGIISLAFVVQQLSVGL